MTAPLHVVTRGHHGAVLCVALAFAAVTLVGCRNGGKGGGTSGRPPGPSDARVVFHLDGRSVEFRVELAQTPSEHARGLMYRDHLAADAGMLFLFDRSAPRVFWMKNTHIPLDIIFLDDNRRVVTIAENAEPETLSDRASLRPARYVLEINGGFSSRLGIRPGVVAELRGVPLPP